MLKSASEEGSTEKLELKTYMTNKAEGKEDAELENKWGFLKNIINIDVFFAGPGSKSEAKADEAESTKDVEKDSEDKDDDSRDVRPGEKIKPVSSWKPSKNDTSKSKKSKKSDLEEALEDGEVVTDSDGNIYKKTDKKKEKEI